MNYEYIETESQEVVPEGDGWEFWGMRITPEESVAVWRRIAADPVE